MNKVQHFVYIKSYINCIYQKYSAQTYLKKKKKRLNGLFIFYIAFDKIIFICIYKTQCYVLQSQVMYV